MAGSKPQSVKFGGINNVLSAVEFPTDQFGRPKLNVLFRAINVLLSNSGHLIFQQHGVPTNLYTGGSCSSLNVSNIAKLFVEAGALKAHSSGNTATTLVSNVGANEFSFTEPIEKSIYFSNGTVRGSYNGTTYRPWGTANPAAQPTCTPITVGGMAAGRYRVAITWIDASKRESGTGNSVEVIVAEGGGIQLSAFPTPPAHVTHYAVWVTAVNSKHLCLYGEYTVATASVQIARKDCTIPLDTQFCYPPEPAADAVICKHFGRIYWSDGVHIRFTHIGRFGSQYDLTAAGYRWPIDGTNVRLIMSGPDGNLYVGTEIGVYRIGNIDGDGMPVFMPQLNVGVAKHAVCRTDDARILYFMSHRGFIKIDEEGLKPLNSDSVELPLYSSGKMTLVKAGGLAYVVFYGNNGTRNDRANKAWNDSLSFPDSSGWAINLATNDVTQISGVSFNAVSNGYAANSTGFGELALIPSVSGLAQTRKFTFGTSFRKRISDAYVYTDSGNLILSVITDNSLIDYEVGDTDDDEYIWLDLARGANGQHWQFEISNIANKNPTVGELQLIVIPIPRH